jgi:DNA-binding transcriptional ArsR family regulator
MLQHIIPSKARRKILALFFQNTKENYYLRRIVREVNEEVNAVKRELDILYEAKVLLKEKRLNKVFYSLNKNWLFFDEFLRIFAKMSPLYEIVHKNHSKLGKVKFLAIAKSLLKDDVIRKDDVSLLFVGVLVLPEVESVMKEVEKEIDREINYTVMTEEEFAFRKKSNDPFVWRFLRQPKIMLFGAEEELVK